MIYYQYNKNIINNQKNKNKKLRNKRKIKNSFKIFNIITIIFVYLKI